MQPVNDDQAVRSTLQPAVLSWNLPEICQQIKSEGIVQLRMRANVNEIFTRHSDSLMKQRGISSPFPDMLTISSFAGRMVGGRVSPIRCHKLCLDITLQLPLLIS